jgi:hypothetical protein
VPRAPTTRTISTNLICEIGLSAKTLKYIEMMVEKEGFGAARPEVIRYCIWQEIHRLIDVKRLDCWRGGRSPRLGRQPLGKALFPIAGRI